VTEEDVSYLDIKPEDRIPMPVQEKAWAQIGEDLKLNFIDWDMINEMARQFDELHSQKKDKSQSQVISKLLALVREVTVAETELRVRAEYAKVK
jgi:retron-type reverse transcriptase